MAPYSSIPGQGIRSHVSQLRVCMPQLKPKCILSHFVATLCNPMDPRDVPNPGIELASLISPALAGRFFTTSTTWEAQLRPA